MSITQSDYGRIRSNVLSKLYGIHSIVKDSGEWLNFRCPFCLDSTKSDNIHFGWRFPIVYNKDTQYIMNCFIPLCEDGKGNPTLRHLEVLGLDKVPGLPELIQQSYLAKGTSLKYFNKEIDFDVPRLESFSDHTEKYKEKLDYFFNRTNVRIDSYDKLRKYKIILDVPKFFKDYSISGTPPRTEKVISFINDGNSLIISRKIIPAKIKHHKKPLVNGLVNHTPYTLSRGVVDGREEYNIYFVEGIFDAVNVFNHIAKDDNCMVVACNSINSMRTVAAILIKRHTFNCRYILVADEDIIEDEKIPRYNKYNRKAKTKIEIAFRNTNHVISELIIMYNANGKDFGDTNEKWDIKYLTKKM